MDENNSLISAQEAAGILGFTSRHIQNMIKKGKLSAIRAQSRKYLIDKSEFYRVFPDAHIKRSSANNDNDNARIVLEIEIQHLKEMLGEKNKQNELLQKQLEMAMQERVVLLDTLNSNQKLLEHKSDKGKRKRFLGIF